MTNRHLRRANGSTRAVKKAKQQITKMGISLSQIQGNINVGGIVIKGEAPEQKEEDNAKDNL